MPSILNITSSLSSTHHLSSGPIAGHPHPTGRNLLPTIRYACTPPTQPQNDMQSILSMVRDLISERDLLRNEVIHSKTVIAELKSQLEECSDTLTSATTALEAVLPPPSLPSPGLVNSLWRPVPLSNPTLSSAYKEWTHPSLPNHQRAIALLCSPPLYPADRLTAKLLLTAILLDCSPPQHEKALREAEDTLTLAERYQNAQAVNHAQLYRGRALMGLHRWGEARWCFRLGAATEGYEGAAAGWEEEVERRSEIGGREGERGAPGEEGGAECRIDRGRNSNGMVNERLDEMDVVDMPGV